MAAPATHDQAAPIGRRVRALREAQGLSLRELAARCGVSAPMLSQVERGETSPTLAVATKIASGLGLTLSGLLRLDEAPTVAIVRSSERRARRRDGHRYEEVSPSLPGERASVSLHTLKAGGRTGGGDDPPLHAPGSRETVLVQRGSLVLILGEQRYPLAEGDAVTFDADLPHHFENPGRSAAAFLAVVAAGVR